MAANNQTGIFNSGPAQPVSTPVSIPAVTETQSPSSSDVVSITSAPPSETVIASATTSAAVSSTESPATVTQSASLVVATTVSTAIESNGATSSIEPSIVISTSTASGQRAPSTSATKTVTTSSSATSKSGTAALASSTSAAGSTGGLSPQGKIAIAVVVPVAAVAIIALLLIIFWRRRKQRKEAEELRRKEVEEYGFNPNHDPTLPAVGGSSSNGDDGEMTQNDSSGYRGWGTTSTARKPSTTLSSGNGPIGVARSTSGSDNGRYTNGSPTGGTNQSSDAHSNDPLMGSSPNGRPLTGDSETVGALGAVPSSDNRQHNINRGPSNASSAYSGAQRSDTSGEGGIPGGAPGQQYYNDGLYYDEGMPQHGPYGDGSYGGGQPVIRDVPARRNTRIENPSVLPPQGSAGIAQNF